MAEADWEAGGAVGIDAIGWELVVADGSSTAEAQAARTPARVSARRGRVYRFM
jgi:hypothetical protein